MNNFLRMTSLVATVAALALTAAPAQAASLVSATPQAQARVKILKALTLTRLADLEFATVVLSGAGAWAGEVVSVNNSGVLSCGTTNLTCSGTTTAAQYNVTGSNNAVVVVSVPATVTITNAAANTLIVTTSGAPTPLTMPNSGNAGINFNFGGSITLASTTPDGSYSGTIAVTADYQ